MFTHIISIGILYSIKFQACCSHFCYTLYCLQMQTFFDENSNENISNKKTTIGTNKTQAKWYKFYLNKFRWYRIESQYFLAAEQQIGSFTFKQSKMRQKKHACIVQSFSVGEMARCFIPSTVFVFQLQFLFYSFSFGVLEYIPYMERRNEKLIKRFASLNNETNLLVDSCSLELLVFMIYCMNKFENCIPFTDWIKSF